MRSRRQNLRAKLVHHLGGIPCILNMKLQKVHHMLGLELHSLDATAHVHVDTHTFNGVFHVLCNPVYAILLSLRCRSLYRTGDFLACGGRNDASSLISE